MSENADRTETCVLCASVSLCLQKQSKVGSSMDEGKKKRRRTQRLVVIYGPSGNFKQELLKKLQEEYDDVFHYPQIGVFLLCSLLLCFAFILFQP